MKKIAPLASKAEAAQARCQSKNVLATSRQKAKAAEEAAFGSEELIKHKGHTLTDGTKGNPHFQTDGKYGHTFWVGAAAIVGSLLDPFDAISGELASDGSDMLLPGGVPAIR